MASFVFHYIAGEVFLDSLRRFNSLTSEEENYFRLGNLVVDAWGDQCNFGSDLSMEEKKKRRMMKVSHKMMTHFRDDEEKFKCCALPKLNVFMEHYSSLVENDYSSLGYLFHLYTDKMFFRYVYDSVIESLDKNYQVTDIRKEVTYIRALKDNKVYTHNQFWLEGSQYSIYDDYSRINHYLLEQYHIKPDIDSLRNFAVLYFRNPGIAGVRYLDVIEVLNKMEKFLGDKHTVDGELVIFDKTDIANFIPFVVDNFFMEYYDEITSLVGCREVKKLCRK